VGRRNGAGHFFLAAGAPAACGHFHPVPELSREDGAVFGLLFGWLYNVFSAGRDEKAPVQKPDLQTPVEP